MRCRGGGRGLSVSVSSGLSMEEEKDGEGSEGLDKVLSRLELIAPSLCR